MAQIGVNVRRLGQDDPDKIAEYGFSWVRIVAMDRQDLLPNGDIPGYVARCHAAGLQVLLMIGGESLAVGGDETTATAWYSYPEAAELYASWYARVPKVDRVDAWQIGNEPDGEGWPPSVADLDAVIAAFHDALPGVPLIGPGMISWQANDNTYLDTVSLVPLRAIDFHPYGAGAPYVDNFGQLVLDSPYGYDDVRNMIAKYQGYGTEELWVTEFGVRRSDFAGHEADAPRYLQRMIAYLRSRTDIAVVFGFCWAEQHEAGFGLVSYDAGDNQAYTSLDTGNAVNTLLLA
jgi:hypothetical protein